MFDQLTNAENDILRAMLLAGIQRCARLCHYVVSDHDLWLPVFRTMQDCNAALQELALIR